MKPAPVVFFSARGVFEDCTDSRLTILILLFTTLLAAVCIPAQAKEELVYVGTYTGKSSKGIYAWKFDPASGQVTSLGLAVEVANPSFLAVQPEGRFLYAVEELGEYEGKPSGAVAAFSFDPGSGKMTLLNQVASAGAYPCFVSLDQAGTHVLVSNYVGGSVIVIPIMPDGQLSASSDFVQFSGKGLIPARQEAPHAHSINLTPNGRLAIVADLGTDRLMVFRYDEANGKLTPNRVPFARTAPGAGPRHLVFSRDGRYVYVLNELASTLTSYAFEQDTGILSELGTVSTLPEGFKEANLCAEVRAHPNGRWLYASNRGHDSIVVFSLDSEGGMRRLQLISSGGKKPRNIALDPSGNWLFSANQDTNAVSLFRVDPETGLLNPTEVKLNVDTPVCVRFFAP